MKNPKETKALKKLQKAIAEYYETHEGNCVINCSVFAFDENSNVVDDRYWIVGYAPCVKLDNEVISEIIKEGNFDESWY
jgi:hypothetical protein